MLTVSEKCDRVKKIITDFPLWWETNVIDMSLDLVLTIGADPRKELYFQLTVIKFIHIVEVLDKEDPDLNEVTKTVSRDIHPSVDFHKLGIQDDIVRDGLNMHARRVLDDMYDDPSLDHPDYYCEDL